MRPFRRGPLFPRGIVSLIPLLLLTRCASSQSNDENPPVVGSDGGRADASGDATTLGDASHGDDASQGDDGSSGDDAADAAPPVDAAWGGRPPSTPLAVRTPYVSTWLGGDSPPTTWPNFWNGSIKAITGIARVDGASFVFFGAPTDIGTVGTATMTSRTLTPTKTSFVFGAGGIALTVELLSPVEVSDLKRQSTPVTYVTASAKSTDGAEHAVSVYFDISGEWAHGDSATQITWARETVPHNGGSLTVQSFTPATPKPLVEVNEYPAWGTAFLAGSPPAGAAPGAMTTAIGEDKVVRAKQVSAGALDGSIDARSPRAISDAWPVAAYSFDLGKAGAQPTGTAMMLLGHARDPAISYKGAAVPPLWKAYWNTWQSMVADAFDDADAAAKRAADLDGRIVTDARAAGGENYAALCSLALRQAFGGTELVGPANKPWLMLKEISSDGNVSTVDVMYPASPVFLYTNPLYMKLLMDPLLQYAEGGGWPKTFAEHDIGSSYPNATGHDDGNEEDMPVEESADMLLMMAAYVQRAKPADASAYATAHYAIAKQWADYLVPNTLDPVNQNQTDDFTGFIDHSVNLALKGILAVGAMGIIADKAGKSADSTSYTNQAKTLMGQWATKAQTSGKNHLLLKYDQDGSWSLKYNAFYDRALGMNLIPSAVMTEESAWYKTSANAVGVPLDPRHTYTKSDWELWTAASIDDKDVRQLLIDSVYKFATTSNARVPFSDWYDTVSGQQQGFQARPVQGGMFTLVALGKSIVQP